MNVSKCKVGRRNSIGSCVFIPYTTSMMYVQVVRLGIDRQRGCAMVQYDSMEGAKEALNSVKGIFLGNSRRLMVSHN